MFLIRHGESEWNARFKVTQEDPGIRDAPLTPVGREQAAAAAEQLRVHDVRRIITSPLTRALETAGIIATALDLPITVEPLVCEQFYYSCDVGTPRSQLSELWSHLDFSHLEEEWWQAQGESEQAMIERCVAFREAMAAAEDWPFVAVVSHWAFIKGLSGKDTRNAEPVRFDPTAEPVVYEGSLGWPASDA
ncbi:MAG: histidine phosphatase family protein [Proteobacteria bacterium]|nr:histidine phosphatase family protein [Pseudomonadota bacterium]